MKREQLSDIISNIDDWLIEEAYQYNPLISNRSAKEIARRNRKAKVKKRTISLPLAAVLILLLTAAAFAIGMSVHEKAQEKLREQLKIEENAVVDYEEAVLPEENSQNCGVTILSTVNDGEFQRVYVNISPVDSDIARSFDKAEFCENGNLSYYEFNFTADGEHFGIARPANTNGFISMEDIIEAAYDEETQTFTMVCACENSMFPSDRPIEITLSLHHVIYKSDEHIYDAEEVQTFGTVTVNPTSNTIRSIRFETPYPFENPVTGGKGKIIGVDLSSFSVDILITHENMETMYIPNIELDGAARTAYFEEQLGWLQEMDKMALSMTLTFSDGSSITGFGAGRTPFENGTVRMICHLETGSININDVICISIGNQTVWESD